MSRIVAPPDHEAIVRALLNSDDDTVRPRALRVLSLAPVDVKGRYLHWTDLRHRTPPAGLSVSDWWAGTRTARSRAGVLLPLSATGGEPFWFCQHNAMSSRLHWADVNAAGSMTGEPYLADATTRRRYLFRSLVDEAISSSQLEGASTTTAEARRMIASGRSPRDHGERMIVNNFHAMEYVREARGEAMTFERLLELHRVLTADTLDDPATAGRLRRPSDPVVVTDNRTRTVVHVPPAADELPERLDELLRFANGDTSGAVAFVHPLVKAVALHFMIGWLHPFVDGNGRTARALFYWSMAGSGYWLVEYLSISAALRRAPITYMHAYLRTETDGNDLTYFIDHQLDVLGASIRRLHDFLERKTGETRATLALLDGGELGARLNLRQKLLLRHAIDHPAETYTIDAHMARHGVTHQTARKDLLVLSDEFDLLVRSKEGRRFAFRAPADLGERIDALR